SPRQIETRQSQIFQRQQNLSSDQRWSVKNELSENNPCQEDCSSREFPRLVVPDRTRLLVTHHRFGVLERRAGRGCSVRFDHGLHGFHGWILLLSVSSLDNSLSGDPPTTRFQASLLSLKFSRSATSKPVMLR